MVSQEPVQIPRVPITRGEMILRMLKQDIIGVVKNKRQSHIPLLQQSRSMKKNFMRKIRYTQKMLKNPDSIIKTMILSNGTKIIMQTECIGKDMMMVMKKGIRMLRMTITGVIQEDMVG